MKYHEAAVRISQTFEMVMRELSVSIGKVYDYVEEGNITQEEAQAYLDSARDIQSAALKKILDPIYEHHPDLRPRYCGCDPAGDTDAEHTQAEL